MKTCLTTMGTPVKPKWLHSLNTLPARVVAPETTWLNIAMGVLGVSVVIFLCGLVIQGLFTIMKLILN
jgi:hypothetical protein